MIISALSICKAVKLFNMLEPNEMNTLKGHLTFEFMPDVWVNHYADIAISNARMRIFWAKDLDEINGRSRTNAI